MAAPTKLVVAQYDLPPLGPRDVLVKNLAASVSGFDLKYRAGRLDGKSLPGRAAFPMPQQLGRDAAGEVVAVGAAVTTFTPGDRVVGVTHPENTDSLEMARGLGNLSRNLNVPGHQTPGSYAQYLVRDEHLWLPLPDGVDIEQAGVTLWAFSTAHRVVRDRLAVRLGDDVLITGTAGGMGQATLQLAKLAGARVIATTRHEHKKAALLESGADAVVVTSDLQRAQREILDFTHGEGVDHAVEYTGDEGLFTVAKNVIRLGGRFVVVSGAPGNKPLPLSAFDLVSKELNVLGIRGARTIDMLTVLKLLGEHRINTRIAARFPLTKIAEAHAFTETSPALIGRVLVLPWA